ncbi:MAG: class I SAM-dependent methyltransferase [Flavobacteriales bacterium]
MNKLLLIILTTALIACKNEHQHHETDHEEHAHHDGHNSANEHMHENSTQELIERFDSPERDAYQQPAKVLEYLGNLKGLKILDIGAGSGYFSFKLLNAGATVIAGDVNDEFLAHIKHKKETEFDNNPNLELRKLPFDSPALQPQEVDKVLIVNTYHHIENRVAYFNQVLKGLKPGGELVVIDFFKKELPVGPPVDHKIDEEMVKKELTEAGFTNIEINTDLLEYQYIIRAK